MVEAATLTTEDGCSALAGLVDVACVNDLKAAGEAALGEAAGEWVVNLGDARVDGSAAVALLVAWVRAARRQEKSVRYVDVPPRLAAIVGLSGVAELLGIDAP